MKKEVALLFVLSCFFYFSYTQHTFSIVAVDTATKEVGSAGASCIDSSIIISDLHPGRGVIHTQAWYKYSNQVYARQLMDDGYTPDQILDSLILNDIGYQQRQYGIIDFDTAAGVNPPRKTAFTGTNTSDWKGHIVGYNYTVQGNILLDSTVIADMETRFLNTSGPLADKLMAALQGAKRAGADSRCMPYETSSLSSFIRVADPGDTTGSYKLNINVNRSPDGIEPVNCLQARYNLHKNGSCSSYQVNYTQNIDTIIDTVFIAKREASLTDTVQFKNQSNICGNYWIINNDTVAVDTPYYETVFDSPGVYNIEMTGIADSCWDKATSQVVVQIDTIVQGLHIPPRTHFKVYPNPVDHAIHIQPTIKARGNYTFTLHNLLGEQVLRREVQLTSDPVTISIPASITTGVYFYSIHSPHSKVQNGKLSILQ